MQGATHEEIMARQGQHFKYMSAYQEAQNMTLGEQLEKYTAADYFMPKKAYHITSWSIRIRKRPRYLSARTEGTGR
jgi:hypothetical protein